MNNRIETIIAGLRFIGSDQPAQRDHTGDMGGGPIREQVAPDEFERLDGVVEQVRVALGNADAFGDTIQRTRAAVEPPQ